MATAAQKEGWSKQSRAGHLPPRSYFILGGVWGEGCFFNVVPATALSCLAQGGGQGVVVVAGTL